MRTIIAAIITIITTFSAGAAINGAWKGKLAAGINKITLRLNFTSGTDSLPTCTLDSPDQGVNGIPAKVTFCSDDSVAVNIPLIQGSYNARINGNKMSGTFRQRGIAFKLDMTNESAGKTTAAKTAKPFDEQEITIAVNDSVTLAGTLSIPAGASATHKVPVALLLTGSGAQNRDEEVFGQRPFAVLADSLARAGIATLRLDDHGVGASTGTLKGMTTFDLANDAAKVIKYLRTLDFAGKVGAVGHSEGGIIADILGADKAIDFVVSMAGPGISGKDILAEQNRRSLLRAGFEGSVLDNSAKLISGMFDAVADGKTIDPDAEAAKIGADIPESILSLLRKQASTPVDPWMKTFIALNPADYIKKITCPMLAINGGKDVQVIAGPNLQAIQDANPAAHIHLYPECNHLFQHATTGEIEEYGSLDHSISPTPIKDIATFILSVK